MIETDSDSSTVDPDDATVVEDTVISEDSTVDQSSAAERHEDEPCLEVSLVQALAHMAGTQLSLTVRSHVDDDMSISSIYTPDSEIVVGTVDRSVKSVSIVHITQVRILLELPVDFRSWFRCWDPYISTWDCFDRRYLSFLGSSICCTIMDLICSLLGVVFVHASSLPDAGISFYTPMLGIVHVSSRPFLLEWVDDITDMMEFTDESQDRLGIDDIQEYAMDSFEDLASSADSFVTTELDSDATVFDTPYGDESSGVDLQSMDSSTPEISDFEDTLVDRVLEEDVIVRAEDLVFSVDSFDTEVYVDASITPIDGTSSTVGQQNLDDSITDDSYSEVTPLGNVPGEEDCRRQSSQRHHVSSQLRVSERDIAIACEHFDVARQLLAVYGWGFPISDE